MFGFFFCPPSNVTLWTTNITKMSSCSLNDHFSLSVTCSQIKSYSSSEHLILRQ